MSSFGDRLREAREARGLSLEAVAEATRIAPHHLSALERGDLAALPAGPFAKGYIEACTTILDVDSGPILEAYRAEARGRGLDAAGAQSRTIDELGQLVGQRAGATGHPGGVAVGKALAIAAIVVVLLGVVGWLVLRGRTKVDSPEVAGAHRAARPETGEQPETATLSETVSELMNDSLPESAAAPAATAEPTPTPDPTVAVANPNIEIPDFGVGTGVEGHRLVGAGDRFPEGGEVVFWNRVVGGDPGDVILHVWLHEGRGIARIPLRIGSPHWRTYSLRPLPQGSAGRWTAEARTPDGRLLARQEFLCAQPGP